MRGKEKTGRANTQTLIFCRFSNNMQSLLTGKFIAIASTTVETSNPLQELEPAIRLLGNYIERFDSVRVAGTEGGREGRKGRRTIPCHFETTTSHHVLTLFPSIPPTFLLHH